MFGFNPSFGVWGFMLFRQSVAFEVEGKSYIISGFRLNSWGFLGSLKDDKGLKGLGV